MFKGIKADLSGLEFGKLLERRLEYRENTWGFLGLDGDLSLCPEYNEATLRPGIGTEVSHGTATMEVNLRE